MWQLAPFATAAAIVNVFTDVDFAAIVGFLVAVGKTVLASGDRTATVDATLLIAASMTAGAAIGRISVDLCFATGGRICIAVCMTAVARKGALPLTADGPGIGPFNAGNRTPSAVICRVYGCFTTVR